MSEAPRAWLRATFFFAALTVAATWPQVVQPAGIPDHRDAWLNMWRIAWVAHQMPRDPARLFDANIYHPERATLAYSDATLLQGLIASPALWLRVPTPYVHTLLVMGSFVFAGVAAWALVRRLTGSSGAGLVAGVVFAFTPYRFDHYAHLELLWTGWMPLTLLAFHRALDDGRMKAGLATGALFAAQAFSCIYYSVFLATVLPAIGAILAVRLPGESLRRAALSLACGALLAALLLAAYVAPYRRARMVVGERSHEEALLYSAGARHYLSATPDNLLYGGLADRLGWHEKRLFPGFLAIALSAIAVWPRVTRVRVAYLVALLLAIDLSFGPNGLTFPLLRETVLLYRGLRVPARAGGVALLMVSVLAGFGWARLEQCGRLGGPSRRQLILACVLAAMGLEYLTIPRTLVAAPTRPEPVYEWLAARTDGAAVVELPLPDVPGPAVYEPLFMYGSTFHWHPLVNGYSGYAPASYYEMRRALRAFPSDAAIDRLREAQVTYIVVHERFYGSAPYRAVTSALDARPDLERHGPFGRAAGEQSTAYALGGRVGRD